VSNSIASVFQHAAAEGLPGRQLQPPSAIPRPAPPRMPAWWAFVFYSSASCAVWQSKKRATDPRTGRPLRQTAGSRPNGKGKRLSTRLLPP